MLITGNWVGKSCICTIEYLVVTVNEEELCIS